ncbi:hypothetical protein [Gimesia chilikensis]|uniref:Integron cassette protein domain-containing protein n=1 Tax=Gimesia chilikensis TaxID=2605989 RepID=A0A517PSV6_9PLAN|nr:hypothetical protein [Gimesia chilikensis]QDT22453.1 hypothetical protein HG66A1_42610 [Gimesia chilikensis]
MKKELNLSLDVYSPRWGRNDTYNLSFDREGISISNQSNAFSTSAKKDEFGYFSWTGYKDTLEKNSLMTIFANDSIYAPSIIPFAIESAWQSWIDGTPDDVISQAIIELFDWISLTAENKPSSDYWVGIF